LKGRQEEKGAKYSAPLEASGTNRSVQWQISTGVAAASEALEAPPAGDGINKRNAIRLAAPPVCMKSPSDSDVD